MGMQREKVTKGTKMILNFLSKQLGHLSLRKRKISGVLESYTGVVLTRHHSSTLCVLPNLMIFISFFLIR